MLKISTEDEALTHEEVAMRVDVFAPLVALELKIGGPGARGDLVLCRRLGIRRMIAPMIESAYGLEDYLAGLQEVYSGATSGESPIPGVNIETRGAAERVGNILAADVGRKLAQVTVGRSDLSKSMGSHPDATPVMALTGRVMRAARVGGYATSIGGGISPANVSAVVARLRPDAVNTRNFSFGRVGSRVAADLVASIRAALAAEIMLCAVANTPLARVRLAALQARLAVASSGTGEAASC